MLQPVVGGFSPEMDRLNPERNPWPEGHATPVVGGFSPEMDGLNPKLGWENPERNPWPKDHATTCSRWL
ncbi:hypothetical protein, partial [Aliiglaciecola sp. NS0011-25]|uniref:hypothetical protein n=1 Tax=Aliiglaciecola sp. NS0011-25 TaxID=3127654 RepID=UPI003340B4F9